MTAAAEGPNSQIAMPGSDKILARLKRMIPPLLDKFHKGQLGRVAVIGGSKDYTGAPYFSAMASARLGCDMSHVICTEAAAAVIKTYSPNLMVHPMMRESATGDDRGLAEKLAVQIIDLVLPRVHVLVLGPGLGRDSLMVETAGRVADEAKRRGLGLVIDADALLLVGRNREIVQGYPAAILTPNVVEFDRLCEKLGVRLPDDKTDKGNESARVEALATALGGVTVIQKGSKDYISNGKETMASDLPGGKKRCGGQGDTLTGSVATFMAWRKAYMDRLWEDDGGEEDGEEDGRVGKKARLGDEEMVGLAAFGGSVITRECSRLAFAKRGRSMQASDLTEEVHNAFMTFFGDIDRDAM